jgi:hypothetical protein
MEPKSPAGKRKRFSASAENINTPLPSSGKESSRSAWKRLEYDDDPTIPSDEMFSSMFHEVRTMKPEMAVFWACALDRRGLGEHLWKCLTIFSFRDIGYAYPEAACFVRSYFCTWLEEMRRYRQELRIRLEYGCTKAVISLLNTNEGKTLGKSHAGGSSRGVRLAGLNQSWVTSILQRGMKSLPEVASTSLLEEIYFHMKNMPEHLLPTYEGTLCSCDTMKQRMETYYRGEAMDNPTLSADVQVTHLTTARHLLINVVHYLCVLPKSTLSRDISYFTAFKCIGTLTENDWSVILSFPNLEQRLYTVRKTHAQPVQQACICLCASIIHKDERRAVDMTDLFSAWGEESLFWETLFVMTHAFPSNYQWIETFLREYRIAWEWTKDCSSYFVEGGRSIMFSAILLFIRGPPQRDQDEPVVSPADISYSKDYAGWFYGGKTPAYESLEFLNQYDKEPEFSESKYRVQFVLSDLSALYDDDDDGEDGESSQPEEEHGPEGLQQSEHEESVDLLTQLVRKMVQEFPGHAPSGTEPYAVKVRGGRSRTTSTTISLSGSAIHTRVSSVRGMARARSTENSLHSSFPSNTARRIGRADREVCVNEYAVDWSTNRGRRMGREVSHAFRVSEVVSRKSMISNDYFDSVEMMLVKQCKKAAKARKEKERLRRIQEHGKRQRRSRFSLENLSSSRSSEDEESSSSAESGSESSSELPLFFESLSSSSSSSIQEGETMDGETPVDVLKVSIRTMEDQLQELKMMPWFDPGLVIRYRKIASEVHLMRNKVEQTTGEEFSSSRFLLNVFDVDQIKMETRISAVGKDDWLEVLEANRNGKTVPNDKQPSDINASMDDELPGLPEVLDVPQDEEGEEGEEPQESESSELGGVTRAIEGMQIYSSEDGNASFHSTDSFPEDEDEESQSELDASAVRQEGCFGEDVYYWERMLHTSPNQEIDPRFAVFANWADGTLDASLTYGPFPSRKEAFRLGAAYELACCLGVTETPIVSLTRWAETMRQLILRHQSTAIDASMNEKNQMSPSAEEGADGVEEEPPSLLDSLMSSMEEVEKERKKAYIPTAVLRKQERKALIDSAGVEEGFYGKENSRGLLIDPLDTRSTRLVMGYTANEHEDVQGWTGPYAATPNKGKRSRTAEKRCYIQFHMKMCNLDAISSCYTSRWLVSKEERETLDRIDQSVWNDVVRQQSLGRTTCFNTEFAHYLGNYYYRTYPAMLNGEYSSERVEHYQWEMMESRYGSDSIPYGIGEAFFFNVLFSLIFSKFETKKSLEELPTQAFLSGQIHVEPEPQWGGEGPSSASGESDTYALADRAARGAVLADYALETPLSMLAYEAIHSVAIARWELEKSDEEYEDFFSNLKDKLLVLAKHEQEEFGKKEVDWEMASSFWTSVAECFNYFIDTADGQEKLKKKLMSWREALATCYKEIPSHLKERMDGIAASETPERSDMEDHHVMDYVVLKKFVHRLDALLLEVMALYVPSS